MLLALTSIRGRYLETLSSARKTHYCFKASGSLSLVLLSALFGVIALIGNLQGGYEFGFHSINAMSQYIPDALLQCITVFGDSALLMGLMLVFAPKNARLHWSILLATLIGGITVNLLKDYFAMPRPPAVLEDGSFILVGKAYFARSFPSGHSFTAFLMATLCFLHCKKPALRWSFMLMASLAGISRVSIGVHWTSDVLIGASFGIVMGIFCVWLAYKWHFGLKSFVHLATLGLIFIASQIVFLHGNDYPAAVPLLDAVAVLAVCQIIRSYFWPSKAH